MQHAPVKVGFPSRELIEIGQGFEGVDRPETGTDGLGLNVMIHVHITDVPTIQFFLRKFPLAHCQSL